MKNYFRLFNLLLYGFFIVFMSFNKCDAQTWDTVGTGLDQNVYGFVTDTVNNVLYAAGHFVNAGTIPVNHIARWDGTSWSALGTGTDQDAYCLAMYNGELYAGGRFFLADGNPCSRIAKWNGTTWQPVGTGMNDDVYYLHVYNGILYAGGRFTTADGIPASEIAMWNGSNWDSLGSGISGVHIYSIQNYQGDIYAVGKFSDAGGVPVNNIAKWDGTAWSDVGGGLTGLFEDVDDLFVYKDELYATGSFLTAGTDTVYSIAKWDGTNWSALGSGLSGAGGYGTVFGEYNGELYLGGNYSDVNGIAANLISRYNGVSWNNLGAGCDQEVDAFETYNGELIVGGAFNNGGGIGIQKIAKWSSGCTAAALASGQNISCMGACDGSVSVYAAGNAPFNYLWSTGNTTSAVTGLCSGLYNITVTDSSGCIAVDSITIVEFALPSVSVSGTSPVCPAQCNGTAVVTATGRAPFTYSWSTVPVQNSDTATLLCAGIYYVTVTDSAGCSVLDSITISDPAAAVLNFSSTLTVCPGVCNGTATVNSSSSSTPFTYAWLTNPIQTTQTADSLCAGIVQVTVTDSLGCAVDSSITISEPPPYSLTLSGTAPLCPASCNGNAYVTSASPFAPLSYSWNTSPVQTTDTATGLCAGIYSVIVIDTMGCISTDSIVISDPVLSLTVSSSGTTCAGTGCNATATAIAAGPVPFTYVWSTTDSVNSIINLCPGTYYVTATDSNNCVLNDSVTIAQPVPPSVNLSYTSPLCYGDCNGIVNATATGTSALRYLWSNGGVDSTITNACYGWYVVTITDSLSCIAIDSVLVLQHDSLALTPGVTLNVSCNGECDGSLSVIVNGGVFPYLYLWSAGSMLPDQLNLCAGTFTLTVTDSNGCSNQLMNVVDQPDSLILDLTSTDATCVGCSDGTLSVSQTGGTPPYLYYYTPLVTDTTHVAAGTYYLCVQDAHACQVCDSTIVGAPNGIFELAGNSIRLKVFPNPFNSTAVINIPASIAGSDHLRVY
ncbi:MAG: hypothetical protein ABIT08_09510, partial [Bacteroidia bacterium]